MDEQLIDVEVEPYEQPQVDDLGSLEDVTQGAQPTSF